MFGSSNWTNPDIAFSDHKKAENDDTETIMESRWILSKFDIVCLCDCTFVLVTIPKWFIWYVTHYIKLEISKHRNYSLYSLFMHKQRYLEISFSRHHNAENEQYETLNKHVRNDDSFQIWFRHYCTFVLNTKGKWRT